jgi:hypothetical protein
MGVQVAFRSRAGNNAGRTGPNQATIANSWLIALSARIPDVIARMAPARYPALLSVVQRLQNRER